jgi:tetratricopeptide (TPR) repeat protein
MIVRDYPSYPQLDEAFYYFALEFEQENQNDRARKLYFGLIQKRPDSKYIPYAYLAFAELFFGEAVQGDAGKWPLARDAYVKVIQYKPPSNMAYGYAWFKLAHVLWRMGEPMQAANAFRRAKESGATFAHDPSASSVVAAATRDLSALHGVCRAIADP